MVLVVPPPPTLSPESISLFYVLDELLARSPILIYYGPSATPTSATPSSNNSRIQAHVFSPAGLQSYPRLTVSPSSPLYAAVNCLPREEQGDDVCRGLAFSLCKYFAELPPQVKAVWETSDITPLGKSKAAPRMFSEAHAALLASRMVRVENVAEVIKDVSGALAEQSVSWMDLDVVLPVGSIKKLEEKARGSAGSEIEESSLTVAKYGNLAPLIRLFGETAFLPTSRLRRAPSRPHGMNRSVVFLRKQKETIRREMCELLDTEENYVTKLQDLIDNIAADFREKAKSRGAASSSPSAEALRSLFPESLDKILTTNAAFLEALRKVIEDTENDAISDIEATTDDSAANPDKGPKATDMTGTVALATCLRTWFPKFGESYAEYTRAHSQFSQLIKTFMNEAGSSFSKRINETGEQRLMSMLIEPVQRLPRYNLYIDNIIKQLPAKHPALKPLLIARDTISEICSQDSVISPARAVDILRRLVPSWPQSFRPYGRLVTAVDAAELAPPYRKDLKTPRITFSILLIFTDYIVVLKKPSRNSLSARGLMAQVDGQDLAAADVKVEDQLSFRQALELRSFDVTEMDHGRMIQIVPNQLPNKARPSSRPGSLSAENATQVFQLMGMHENRASRVLEDVVKARVEGRFSEAEREDGKWEVRAAQSVDMTFFTSFSEEHDSQDAPEGRGAPAKIRLRIEPEKCKYSAMQPGVDVYCSLSTLEDGFYRLEITGQNDFSYRDDLTPGEFLPVLTKRLGNFLQLKNQIKNSAITKMLILKNQHILQSLKIVISDMSDGTSTHSKSGISRPHSPVKMLSSLFSGASSRENLFKRPTQYLTPTMSMDNIPNLAPQGDTSSMIDIAADGIVTHSASARLEQLEETLSSYVLALHARKGNIVGRTLLSRHAMTDETAVNDLYNALLETGSTSSGTSSTAFQLAAQAPVDVLFAAFERFVRSAWHDKMGSVISQSAWQEIQAKLDGMSSPHEFEEVFRAKFADMSPQNQRALKSIIKLLGDLLSGTGNDGDRGILTASFADVLAPPGGDSRDFVGVLDCLIEDSDALLSERQPGYTTPTLQQSSGSISSETRHGSRSGQTSSLRKKFGLLTRKGSKSQHGTPSSTFSIATNSQPTTHSSLSKATSLLLSRSNSDAQHGSQHGTYNFPVLSPGRRPVSRDRPTVLGAFGNDSAGPPPGSSGSTGSSRPLSTIGETPSSSIARPKKKRRSSLSDLVQLREQQAAAGASPAAVGGGYITPRTPGPGASPAGHISGLQTFFLGRSPSPQQTPSPVKTIGGTFKGSMIPQPSMVGAREPSRPASPVRRENSPVRGGVTGVNQARSSPTKLTNGSNSRPGTSGSGLPQPMSPRSDVSSSGTITITSHPPPTSASPKRRTTGSVTGIPLPKAIIPTQTPGLAPPNSAGLSERPNSGNVRKLPPTPGSQAKPSPTEVERPKPLNVAGKSRAAGVGASPVRNANGTSRERQDASFAEDASGLAAELRAVGEELASLPREGHVQRTGSKFGHVRTKSVTSGISLSQLGASASSQAQIQELETRVNALAAKQASLTSSAKPAQSEDRLKAQIQALDSLNRELSAENDVLYSRFNEELSKILGSVKGGKVDEEWRKRVKDAEDDAGKLRRENARLRRELALHAGKRHG